MKALFLLLILALSCLALVSALNVLSDELNSAIKNDNLEEFQRHLIEKDINEEYRVGNRFLTLLHLAADCGSSKVASVLLKKKANVNAVCYRGGLAAKNNRSETGELLLGVLVDYEDTSKWTPLHYASYYGNFEVVKLLLENDAAVDAACCSGNTSLSLAAKKNHPETVKLLLEKGAAVGYETTSKWTPLHYASYYGSFEAVKLLIDAGANPNSKNKDDMTPLLFAVARGHPKVVAFLLDNGADETAVSNDKETVLHCAAGSGCVEVLRMFIDRFDIEARNDSSRTPLYRAIAWRRAAAVTMLLERGAESDIKDNNGCTPLNEARRVGYYEIAKIIQSNLDAKKDDHLRIESLLSASAVEPSTRTESLTNDLKGDAISSEIDVDHPEKMQKKDA